MKKITFLLFFLNFVIHANSQELKDELRMAINNMMPVDYESTYEASIKYYDRNDLNRPVDSMFLKYSFCNKSYIVKMDDIETIQNDSFFVTLSKDDRIMAIGRPNGNINQLFDYNKLDSLFLGMDLKVSKISNKSREEYYRIYSIGNTIDSLDIAFEDRNHLLKTIMLYFSKDYKATEENLPAPIVKISYFNFQKSLKGEYSLNKYDTGKYFTLRDNKVEPTKLYVGYKIVNDLRYDQINMAK